MNQQNGARPLSETNWMGYILLAVIATLWVWWAVFKNLSQSTGVSGVCFWVQSLSIKVICFYSVFNGLALCERGVRNPRKNPLKWWDEFSFKGMVQAGTNKTDSGHSC